MTEYFSVDTVFFTVLDYPLSYIEFFGTVLYLWSVWLIARRNLLTWPVGIVSVLLYMLLFYQVQLYSDALEQVYYLVVSVYGWWYWSRSPRVENAITDVAFSTPRTILAWVCATLAVAAALGATMSQVHVLLPRLFVEPAAYPYLDALTTVMSFVAMWLMARKCVESWVYWIIVDVIGIGLYYVKDIRFVALLYVFLLILAIRGLADWNRIRRAGARHPEPPGTGD